MELEPIYKRAIGLDIHQAQITACALIEHTNGSVRIEQRQFGGFKKDRPALAQWAALLARGALRASFVPPALLPELRLIARQRQNLVGQLASEKNRLQKC